jgi:DNA polymerase-3 subunit alpha
LKEIITKKGERMGFVTLEDLSGSVEVVVFADVYVKAMEYLKAEEPIMVTGAIDIGEKSTKVMASDIALLRDITERETKLVRFTLKADGLERRHLESLKEIISRYRGPCRSLLQIDIPGACRATITLPDACRVAPSEELLMEVNRLVGYNAVTFV